MTNTTNTANSRFAVAYGSAFLYAAVLFFWESLRPSAGQYLRGASVIASVVCLMNGYKAIARRHEPRPAPTTNYPRATIAASLFPIGLAGGAVWYFTQTGDVYYLLAAPPIIALGIWGVVVGLKELRRPRT
jgi:hypothetical protein